MSESEVRKAEPGFRSNLGSVSAYGDAKEKGYTGTLAEFEAEQMKYLNDSRKALEKSAEAKTSADAAKTSADTATEQLQKIQAEVDKATASAEKAKEYEQAAEIKLDDSSAVSKKVLYSSQKLYSTFGEPFTKTAPIVTCHPYEGTGLEVTNKISQPETPSASLTSPATFTNYESLELEHCGKNLQVPFYFSTFRVGYPGSSVDAGFGTTLEKTILAEGEKLIVNQSTAGNPSSPSHQTNGLLDVFFQREIPGPIVFSFDVKVTQRLIETDCLMAAYISGKGQYGYDTFSVPNGKNFFRASFSFPKLAFASDNLRKYIGVYLSGLSMELSNFQIETGTHASAHTSYHGQTYTALPPSPIAQGTYNWQTGECTKDVELLSLKVADMNMPNDSPGWQFFNGEIWDIVAQYAEGPLYVRTNIKSGITDMKYCTTSGQDNNYIKFIDRTLPRTQTEWKAQYPDLTVQILLPYRHPTTVTGTPVSITAMDGVNNLYSNCGETTVSGTQSRIQSVKDLKERVAALEAARISTTSTT